jgi:type II secretory pathway component GspD/PulD (secretin)
LNNAISAYGSSDIMNALRNILTPTSKVILLPSQNVIAVASTPDQITQAKAIVHEFDRPPKRYRLTYTIIDLDGTRRIGEQRYSMVALDGQKMTLKQGSKVPVTIENSKDNSSQQVITYLDIGMNFEAMINSSGDSANLQTKVGRSSIAEERSGIGPQDPIVRQSVFEGASILTMGKTETLGSIDFPGSTRHLDIQVMAERIN